MRRELVETKAKIRGQALLGALAPQEACPHHVGDAQAPNLSPHHIKKGAHMSAFFNLASLLIYPCKKMFSPLSSRISYYS